MYELTDGAAEALSRTELPGQWNAEQHSEPLAPPRLRSLVECLGGCGRRSNHLRASPSMNAASKPPQIWRASARPGIRPAVFA